jgi:hypothetical protein
MKSGKCEHANPKREKREERRQTIWKREGCSRIE